MLTKDTHGTTTGVIDSTLSVNTLNYPKTAVSAFYFKLYQGSLHDYIGAYNSGDAYGIHYYPRMTKIFCSEISGLFSVGQAKTVTIIMPLNYYDKDYNTGKLTLKNTVIGIPTHSLAKGYIIRAFQGYAAPDNYNNISTKAKFTGIINSIVPNETNNTLSITCVDFSVIPMGELNYGFPDINSYRDAAVDADRVQPADLYNDALLSLMVPAYDNWILWQAIRDVAIKSFLYPDTPASYACDSKLTAVMAVGDAACQVYNAYEFRALNYMWIDSECVYITSIDLNTNTLSVDRAQRGTTAVQHEAYADVELDCVDTTRTWLNFDASIVTDALRLGKSEEYPFMRSRHGYEYINTTITGPSGPNRAGMINKEGPNTTTVSQPYVPQTIDAVKRVDKLVYLGLDAKSLESAKYKFDFGKSLWDCILSMCEEFGLRAYCDEFGVLTIAASRRYKWVAPAETNSRADGVENHIWTWHYWKFKNTSADYTYVTMPAVVSGARVIRGKFVSMSTATPSATAQLQYLNGATWTNYGSAITIPVLPPYTSTYIDLWEAVDYTGALSYKWRLVATSANETFFNGFYYLDNDNETVAKTLDSSKDCKLQSGMDSSTEVRNRVTTIGKPKSAQPLVSRATDSYSIFGGASIAKAIGIPDLAVVYTSNNSVFLDGRYDKFDLLKCYSKSEAIIYSGDGVNSLTSSIKTLIMYLKPGTSATITIKDAADTYTLASKVVSAADYSSAGVRFNLLSPVGANRTSIFIHSTADLYVSEIECYSDDMTFNYIGYKKETLIVVDNVTDKSTNDWITNSTLDTHRGNIQQIGADCLGDPYFQIADCITVIDIANNLYANTKFWIQGISFKQSNAVYQQTLTLSSVPPAQTYVKPPEINPDDWSASVYNYSMTLKNKNSNSIVSETANGGTVDVNSVTQSAVFNFALVRRMRVMIRVNCGVNNASLSHSKNTTYAYPLEEKIFEPGVYKRENGITWDFGINFEERFGSLVDKIYLFPTKSGTNYVYVKTFIPFSQDIYNTNKAAMSHAYLTPPYYEAQLLIRGPYETNSTSSQPYSVADTWQQAITITVSNPDKYTVLWDAPDNILGHAGDKVTLPLTVNKNGVALSINDSVYIDALAVTDAVGNVNQVNAQEGAYAAPRYLTTAALIQEVVWDYTDSQGRFVAPGFYRLQIYNCFSIDGEEVPVLKGSGFNLAINGGLSLAQVSSGPGNLAVPPFSNNPTTPVSLRGWEYSVRVVDTSNTPPIGFNFFGGGWGSLADKGYRMSADLSLTGGQGDNKEYYKMIAYKNFVTAPYAITMDVSTTSGELTTNAPAMIMATSFVNVDKDSKHCLSAYFKCSGIPNGFDYHDFWKIRAVIIGKIVSVTTGAISYYSVSVPLTLANTTDWQRLYTSFSPVGAIKIGFVFYGCEDNVPISGLTWADANAPSLGIDSIELAVGETPVIPYSAAESEGAYISTRFEFS